MYQNCRAWTHLAELLLHSNKNKTLSPKCSCRTSGYSLHRHTHTMSKCQPVFRNVVIAQQQHSKLGYQSLDSQYDKDKSPRAKDRTVYTTWFYMTEHMICFWIILVRGVKVDERAKEAANKHNLICICT